MGHSSVGWKAVLLAVLLVVEDVEFIVGQEELNASGDDEDID